MLQLFAADPLLRKEPVPESRKVEDENVVGKVATFLVNFFHQLFASNRRHPFTKSCNFLVWKGCNFSEESCSFSGELK